MPQPVVGPNTSPAVPDRPDYLQLATECLAAARDTALHSSLPDATDRAHALVAVARGYQDLGERRR